MLARIGGYALRYQPAARSSRNWPQAEHWLRSPASTPAGEQARLLRDLLDQADRMGRRGARAGRIT
ncbi:MAG TPA: hypothetical protein VFU22_18410 [Roseiflexaceae bacterium]|nr:hypothetical protein [Roseiflexaceae bacterium]